MDLAGDQEPKLDVIHHKWTPIMNNASIGVGYRKVMFSFSPRFRNKKQMSNESVRTRADETREQTKSNEQDKCSGRGEKIYDQEKVGPVLVLSLGASERCSRCPTDNRTARDARWREVNQRQLLEGRDDLLSLFGCLVPWLWPIVNWNQLTCQRVHVFSGTIFFDKLCVPQVERFVGQNPFLDTCGPTLRPIDLDPKHFSWSSNLSNGLRCN